MFVDEIKNIVVSKMSAEEKMIEFLRERLVYWAKLGLQSSTLTANFLVYDLKNTGVIESDSFNQVMKGLDFVINFFTSEGFNVETKHQAKDLIITITWEKN
jgi:hypothetical protein